MKYSICMLVAFVSVFLSSCSSKVDEEKTGTIIGVVNCGFNDLLGGVEVKLQNASDEADVDIAFSEQNGSFVFRDVKEGFYYISPSKNGYYWIWTVVGDNEPIHRNTYNKQIRIDAGEIVNVKLLMSGRSEGDITVLDAQGNPIDKLVINKGVGSVSFVLFNGTGSELYYYIWCRCLFSASFDAFYLFTSINPDKGYLSPGESVMITCDIDSRVYSSSLSFYDEIEITSSLKLPLSLNWVH